MQRLLFTAVALLLGCNASPAQVSTMGTTAMGLSSTPGTIVTSPLNGPSPFSATTQPGVPDTMLAPVPLASDPTIPGTVVTCSTPTGQITPGTPAVPVTSLSSMAGTIGTTPSISAPPKMRADTAPSFTSIVGGTTTTSFIGSTNTPFLPLSAQPATSFMTDFPGTTIPAPQPPTLPALPSPSITPVPVPMSSTVRSTNSAATPGTVTMTSSTTTMSRTAMTP